ncbi:lytic transglycosylase [Paludibacterium denitrificans]|uniref:lytic transglycosylase n=1 Tax=Paludibacterium denitrificans TaxID=2675226 RepID=UPI001E52FFD5|nr:LysM peptidoglycan-binding domain-containing protein [Paludibacterium denitrificans]
MYTPTSTESAADVASQHGMTTSELLAVNKVHSGTLQAGRPVLVAMRGNNNAPLEGGDNLMQDNSAVMVASAKPAVVRTPAAQPLIVVQRDKPVTVAEVAKPVSAPKAVAPVMLAKADTTISSTPATSAPTATATPTVTAPITTAQAPASQVLPAAQTTTIPAAATIVTARAETVQVAKVAEPVKARPVSLVKVAETRVARINPNASQHTVAAGDTLYNISRRYNISVADLKALNQLNEDVVKLGQVLKVKGNAQTLVASRTTEAGNSAQDDALLKVSGLQATRVPATGATPSTYVVQRGDTVYSIARRFGVNHADIQRWNGAGQVARLQPGQQVRIEVQGL